MRPEAQDTIHTVLSGRCASTVRTWEAGSPRTQAGVGWMRAICGAEDRISSCMHPARGGRSVSATCRCGPTSARPGRRHLYSATHAVCLAPRPCILWRAWGAHLRPGGPQAFPIHLRFGGVGLCTYALCSCRTCPPRPSPRPPRCPRRQPPVSCVRCSSQDACGMRWGRAGFGVLPSSPARMHNAQSSVLHDLLSPGQRPRVLTAAVRHVAVLRAALSAHAWGSQAPPSVSSLPSCPRQLRLCLRLSTYTPCSASIIARAHACPSRHPVDVLVDYHAYSVRISAGVLSIQTKPGCIPQRRSSEVNSFVVVPPHSSRFARSSPPYEMVEASARSRSGLVAVHPCATPSLSRRQLRHHGFGARNIFVARLWAMYSTHAHAHARSELMLVVLVLVYIGIHMLPIAPRLLLAHLILSPVPHRYLLLPRSLRLPPRRVVARRRSAAALLELTLVWPVPSSTCSSRSPQPTSMSRRSHSAAYLPSPSLMMECPCCSRCHILSSAPRSSSAGWDLYPPRSWSSRSSVSPSGLSSCLSSLAARILALEVTAETPSTVHVRRRLHGTGVIWEVMWSEGRLWRALFGCRCARVRGSWRSHNGWGSRVRCSGGAVEHPPYALAGHPPSSYVYI
ncbi:hypothetical protein C8R46DRAFT_1115737 [Mycena filopes]|nr:hypothetical protein C8R46DRAFT_1115737 [Mycena filopes]